MSKTTDNTDYLTVTEAAEKLGTTITKILMLIRRYELKGREIDGEWFLEPESLACWKSHGTDMKEARGRDSHCSSGGCGCR